MQAKHFNIFIITAVCLVLTSCFKDEPLNAECDIEQAYIHTDSPSDLFFTLSDTLVSVPSDKSDIIFRIKEEADLTKLAPILKVTQGATVKPESGSEHDFSDGRAVTYIVTSQDRQWSRTYSISFNTYYYTSKFSFEHYKLIKASGQGEYYAWSDLNSDGSESDNWATGNAGFNICMGGAAADEYPTVPVTDGYEGAAVKLETKDTGALGALVNMRLAAGNLFTGSFDVLNAFTDPLKATQFGITFNRKPLRLTGWYKYRPGNVFQNKDGNTVEGKTDEGDIYAVMYRNHDADGNPVVLYGDDIKTSGQIVAIASVDNVETTDEWTEFNADFNYSNDIDSSILENMGYSLAIVFTSSKEGASFSGAIGSTLHIDEVEVIWEE